MKSIIGLICTIFVASQTTDADEEEAVVVVEPSQNCLYCKRADLGASFLNTYSYCSNVAEEGDFCTEKSWNFID